MYPEPKDILDILTWLVSSISFSLEQVDLGILFDYRKSESQLKQKVLKEMPL